jgi:cytochrome c556
MATVKTTVFLLSAVTMLAATPPTPQSPAASSYAPADDLLREVDFFIERTGESLADPAAFDLAKQSRTLKDANALAALALVLAMHDQDFPHKAAMPQLVRAAQQLAAAEGDYDKAAAALALVEAARAGKVEPGGLAQWEKVASLPALMKHVPLVHSRLQRGVDKRRLARSAEASTAQSAALAAIAQASMFDTEYAKTPGDVEKWQQQCAEMRDAAGSVNAAIHVQDAERVTQSMKRLVQSCEACHATFRSQ